MLCDIKSLSDVMGELYLWVSSDGSMPSRATLQTGATNKKWKVTFSNNNGVYVSEDWSMAIMGIIVPPMASKGSAASLKEKWKDYDIFMKWYVDGQDLTGTETVCNKAKFDENEFGNLPLTRVQIFQHMMRMCFENMQVKSSNVDDKFNTLLSEEWGVALYSIVWHNDVSSSLHSKSTFTADKVLLRQRFPTHYTSTTSSTTKKFVNHDVSVTVKDIPNFNTRSGMDMLRSVLNMSQNKYAAIANPSGWEKPERAKNGLLFNQDIVIHNPGYVRINGRNGKNQVAGVSDPYVDFDTTFARMLGLVRVDKSGNLHLGTNLSVLGVKSDNSSVAKSGDVVTKVSGGDFVRLSGLADYLVTGIDDRWGVDQSNLSSSLLRVYCDVSQSSYIGGIKAGVISEVPFPLDDLQLLQETANVRQIIDQDENYESRRLRLNQEHRRMQRIRKSLHKNQMQFEKACFFHAPEMHGKLLEVQFKIARHLGWRRRPSNVMENVLQETALDVGRDRVLLICQELLDDIQRQWKRQLKTILFGKIVQDFVKGKK